MKGIVSVLLLSFLLTGCAGFQRITRGRITDKDGLMRAVEQEFEIPVPDQRLPESETLTYQVKWMGIPIGKLTTAIKGKKEFNGNQVYVLEMTMKTNAFLSMIYKINDRYVSYMDAQKLHTLRQEVYRREGGYRKNAITDFDQEQHTAHFRNLLDKSEFDFTIPEGVHDVVSGYYYFSLLPLKVGDTVEFYISNSEENYHIFNRIRSTLRLRVPTLGKKEKNAFLLQPYAELEGTMVEKGSGNFYYSCGSRRVLLFAVLKAPIFTRITVSLVKVESSLDISAYY